MIRVTMWRRPNLRYSHPSHLLSWYVVLILRTCLMKIYHGRFWDDQEPDGRFHLNLTSSQDGEGTDRRKVAQGFRRDWPIQRLSPVVRYVLVRKIRFHVVRRRENHAHSEAKQHLLHFVDDAGRAGSDMDLSFPLWRKKWKRENQLWNWKSRRRPSKAETSSDFVGCEQDNMLGIVGAG